MAYIYNYMVSMRKYIPKTFFEIYNVLKNNLSRKLYKTTVKEATELLHDIFQKMHDV